MPDCLTPVTLRRRQMTLSIGEKAIIGFVLLGMILAFVAVLSGPLENRDWARTAAKAWQKISERPQVLLREGGAELVVVLLAGALHLWYAHRSSKYERVVVDDRGIRYESPLPVSIASWLPSWSHSWAQVRGVEIVIPKIAANPNPVTLVLDAVTVKRKLTGQWEPVDDPGVRGTPAPTRQLDPFFALVSSKQARENLIRSAENSPLVEYMRRMGVKVLRREAPATIGLPLESSRPALAAAVTVFVLLAYTVTDLMVNTETYAVVPPLQLYALAGALIALASGLGLAWAGVARFETLGLALLLGGTAAFALYPGLLRINALTDTEGLRPYEFRLTDYIVLDPADPRLPQLRFSEDYEYWQQFGPGSSHEFMLRKGGLGLYQVDLAPLHAKLREFYWKRR